MANSVRQELTTGSPELHRRIRSFFGLLTHIAETAEVTTAHASYVASGQRRSAPLMKVILRELARAEAGNFRRAA